MSAPTILIPKYSVHEKKIGRPLITPDPGRTTDPKRGYQSPAAYLDDLAAMKKAIILCSFCVNKWGSPRKKGYRARYVPDPSGVTSGYSVVGQCDACKQKTADMGGGKVYVSADMWSRVSMNPVEARRRARDLWQKRQDMWEYKQQLADARYNPHKYRPKKVHFAMSDTRRFK